MRHILNLKHAAILAATTGLMFTSLPTTAFADETVTSVQSTTTPNTVQTPGSPEITQEQAVRAAKGFYSLPENYSMSNVSYQTADTYSPWPNGLWNIEFQSTNQGIGSGMHNFAHFSVDANTGKVVSFFMNASDASFVENAISDEDSQRIAKDLLKKLDPDRVDQVRLMGSNTALFNNDPQSRNYTFVRLVNGIPYANDAITIQLDSKGNLIQYGDRWSDTVKFPSQLTSISADQAQAIYNKNLQVTLQYAFDHYNNLDSQAAKLVYATIGADGIGSYPIIDATSGQVIDHTGKPVTNVNPPVFSPLSSQSVLSNTKELTMEQVLEIVKQYPIHLDSYTLQSIDYQQGTTNQDPQWNLSYTKNGAQESIQICISAKTGDLIQFFRPMFGGPVADNSSDTVNLSYDQAKQAAINWIQKTLPSRANTIAFDQSFTNSKVTNGTDSFRFVSLHDAIPTDNYITVSINGSTGDVDNFFSPSNTSTTYPSKSQITITPDKAKQEYLINSNLPLTLQYIPLFDYDQPNFGQPSKVVLAYTPYVNSDPFGLSYLDAVAGNWVSPYQNANELSTIKDIKGNWAEKYLSNLYLKGAIKAVDNKLFPDKTVTRSEAVHALIILVGMYSQVGGEQPFFQDVKPTDPDYSNIQQAARLHWISTTGNSFKPNDTLTREDLAAWVASALGYSDLTKVPGVVTNHFTDLNGVSAEYVNDIGIASALDVMVGADGKFRPHDPVNRAELAVVMTRLADHIRQKI